MSKVDSAAQVERLSQPAPPPSSAPQSLIPPGPVEARSLSAITTIASNPPAYPRNPTQKKLDPLVLYIVRVPGSKDVFLSPLKPPTKASVSAEAINSSLYYLHVSGPEDEVLMHEVEAEREVMRENGVGEDGDVLGSETNANANADFVRLNNVKRKPVRKPVGGDGGGLDSTTPATAAPSQEPPVSAHPESESLGHLQPGTHDQDTRIPTDDPPPPPLPQRPPRRPLPPIPNEEPSLEPPESGHPSKASNRWSALSGYINNRGLESWREKYESLAGGRRRSGSDSRPRRVNSARGRATESPTRSPGPSPRRMPEDQSPGGSGFHITLIRRDPTHGSQWNVATMSTPRMDGSPIDIEISTPGYNRFAGQEQLSLASLGLNLPSDGRNPPGPGPKGLQSEPPNGQQQQQQSGPRKFHRQLCVSRPYHEDTRSSDSFSRTSTDDGSPRLKSGYYTFTSPWNGTCTFATSVNGRSLKCKHMIPLPSHAVSNPNYQPPQNPAITAAEIRFNTPFQAGHLPHQPSPNHLSPFTLSQTQTFHHQANLSDHQPPITSPTSAAQTTSKRDTVAQFLNPNIYSRHLSRPRSRSNTNNPPQLPPRPHPHPTPTPSHKRHPSTSSTSSAGADAEDDPTPEERMDLSLAREPAGGGMRGKSAKLGKLIVDDEGVKMLDLVVAACMAVWWKGYYY